MTSALVIGYGSIGQRHARVLTELGCAVSVVSRRGSTDHPCHGTIEAALAAERPDVAVIADETSRHRASLQALDAAGYTGRVLVEKPLFEASRPAYRSPNPDVFVAYNLRFHPLVQRLRDLLAGCKTVAVQAHVGQHLADWRPGRDWRSGYSADPARGGGVLRDLSHEIDLLAWLWGDWQAVAALGGCSGTLGIASDDSWSILGRLERTAMASLSLNYLDRPVRRFVAANTDQGLIVLDFLIGSLTCAETGLAETVSLDRDATYRAQAQALLAGETGALCRQDAGAHIVAVIEAIEAAAQDACWHQPEDPQ